MARTASKKIVKRGPKMAQIAKYIQEAIAKCQEAFDMAHDEDDTKTGADETACDIKTTVETEDIKPTDVAGDKTDVAGDIIKTDVAVTGNLVEVAA